MNTSLPERASAAQVLKATATSLVVSAVILVAVVWPLAFGIGPVSPPSATDLDASANASNIGAELEEIIAGDVIAAPAGAQKSHADAFKSDTVEIEMAAFEEVEFKAHMNEGDTMVYSWRSPEPVFVDMHGEPWTYPDDKAVRYEALDGVRSGNGRVIAPFAGMHGWYWLNTSDRAIVIELKVSGYYSRLEEVYRNSQQ